MQRRQFEQQMRDLLRAPVEGMTIDDKTALIGRHIETLAGGDSAEHLALRFEPFVPGRRPDDEATYPGLGSSEQVGLFDPDRSPSDHVKLLARCFSGRRLLPSVPPGLVVTATIEAIGEAGEPMWAVRGWSRRDITSVLVPVGGERDSSFTTATPPALVLDLDVNEVFAPSDAHPAGGGLGFGSLFHQRFRVAIDVEDRGARVTGDEIVIEIHDEACFGSLYQRLADVLLTHDTEQQAHAIGRPGGVPVSSHPWYPVLCIGMQKATLYMTSITADLVEQKHALTDPGWLLRVGLYLELLTFLGIVEAVRDSMDLLTPAERHHFEHDQAYAEIRECIDAEAWSRVWQLRQISFGRKGTAGAANLLRKKNATFAFLHAHHEDLKHAIRLAGPNLHNAQETWHRVYRDAERAVLQMNSDAFPELRELPPTAREFALWHERGSLGRLRFAPGQLTEIFGDHDGVFPSACREYRASMNHVASWALDRGLMEYTGQDCIPPSASLIEAHLSHRPALFAQLQRRDGFAGSLDIHHEEQQGIVLDREAVIASLQRVELFSLLGVDELGELTNGVRPIVLGHLERIIIEGREGSSMFMVHDGRLEIIAGHGGGERQLAVLDPPAIVGELAFLLDEPRSATVRAMEQAVVLEICAVALRPLVEARPELLDGLTALLEERRQRNTASASRTALRERIRRVIFAA